MSSSSPQAIRYDELVHSTGERADVLAFGYQDNDFYLWMIRRVVMKYGIPLLFTDLDSRRGVASNWKGIHLGPNEPLCAVDIGHRQPRVLVHNTVRFTITNRAIFTARLLHELVHAILGRHSLRTDETYVLLAFEWRLALELANYAPCTTTYTAFIDAVQGYQEGTPIRYVVHGPLGPEYNIHNYFRPWMRKEQWYAASEQRAVRIGLLDNQLRPTWRRPRWKNSGVPLVRRFLAGDPPLLEKT